MDRDTVGLFIRSLHAVSDEDEAWSRLQSNPRPYIAEFQDARVIRGSRIVVTKDGMACSDELVFGQRHFRSPPKDKSMSINKRGLLEVDPLEYAEQWIPAGVHLTCEYQHNYFHWISEILARLYLFERMTDDKSVPLLITDGLHPNLYALLDLVRASERPVIRMTDGVCYRVGRLTYPSDVSRNVESEKCIPSHASMFVPAGLIKAMVSELEARVPKSGREFPKKLYLVRNRSWRIPVNQEDVASLLARHEFTQIDLATVSALDQIEMFSSAEQIVAPSGATCSNILWMRGGTHAIVLTSDHPFFVCPYWDAFARSSAVNLSYLISPRMGYRDTAHDDFEVDLSALEAAIL
ncbi:glycosyltransferase family 61 protein [uncultured Roseobacter sp.]|uniref:glycosyltransferase family 61 protein n=1 Tax=uncultured Roseobacter sp. TaxID=114847 RepID=UPI002624B36C|nr:glycosyltransferase family 61 protein [uncultured Roseobacter sp.]